MKKENEFILELCKWKTPNFDLLNEFMNERLDYPYILGQLLYNRVGAIAYTVLKNSQFLSKTNREFRNSLKAVYEYNLNKTDSFMSTLDSLRSICSSFRFPYAFLKGAYLAQIYDKGLRTSNDIDILVNAHDITELSNLLKEAGFKQGSIRNEVFIPASRKEIISSRMNRGETMPFVKKLDLPAMSFLEVDVNFSLGFRPGADEKTVTDMLERTQPLILNSISTLDRADFLVHLCAHLFKEATVMSWVEMGRDVSLYKYCDIYLFIHEFFDSAFASSLIQRINDMHLNNECYFALYYSKELFDIKNDELDKVMSAIKPTDVSFMTQIVEPQTGKVYSYNMNYKEWVFCKNRRGELYETRYVGK